MARLSVGNTYGLQQKTGWNTFKTSGEIIKLTARLQSTQEFINDEYYYPHGENHIRKELIGILAGQIAEHITITKQHDFRNLGYEFIASVNLASPGTLGCVIDTEKYVVNGLEFNNDQIQEAILNTFPELFL